MFDTESTDLNANIGHLLCVGWKVLGESRTHVIKISDFELFDEDPTDDYAVVAETLDVMKDADGWVGWYSSKHDVPFIQTRLMWHGLKPLPRMSAHQHIDCWRIARYRLKLNSNRLETVDRFLYPDGEGKKHHDWRTWERAAAGHLPSLNKIYRYCQNDVDLTERAYEALKILDLTHFNINLCVKGTGAPAHFEWSCPTCGKEGSLRARGWRMAKVRRMQRFQCQVCGAWCQGPPQKVKGVEVR